MKKGSKMKALILLWFTSLFSMQKVRQIPTLTALSFHVCLKHDCFDDSTKGLFCQAGLRLLKRNSPGDQNIREDLREAFDVVTISEAYKKKLKITEAAYKLIAEDREKLSQNMEKNKATTHKSGYCKAMISRFEATQLSV